MFGYVFGVLLLQRSRLEENDFIFVGGGDLSRVDGAMETRDLNVVMAHTGNDLDAFKGAGEDYNVAASGIGLWGK